MSIFKKEDGILYVMEDHKKPNIIRGNGPKIAKKRKCPPEAVVLKQDLASHHHHLNGGSASGSSGVVNPSIRRSNSSVIFDPLSSINQQIVDSNQHVVLEGEIPDGMEILESSNENSNEANGAQIYQASIQTDAGNFVVLVRDGEIIAMQPEGAAVLTDENGQYVLQQQSQDEEDISQQFISAENPSSPSSPVVEEVEGNDDGEESSSEQNQNSASNASSSVPLSTILESDSSSSVDIQGIETEIPNNSVVEADLNNDEQYVVVELSDGTSILLPASSLQQQNSHSSSSGIMLDNSNNNQIYVDGNSDHLVQVISGSMTDYNSSSNEFSSSIAHNSSASSLLLPNKPKRPAKKKLTDNPRPINKKPCLSGNNNSTKFSPTTTSMLRSTISSVQHQHYANYNIQKKPTLTTSNSYIPHAQTVTTAATSPIMSTQSLPSNNVNYRPGPELKPRPFRFDFPEDEEFGMEAAPDYLSLVIQQYQKENK